MNTRKEEKEIYNLFKGSILIKGAISLAEIIAGVVVFFVPSSFIVSLAQALTHNELGEDPASFGANHLLSAAHALSLVGTTLIGLYLISRGAIKLGLIIALLKNKLWAYPASLIVLGVFVIFQVYEIINTGSLSIIGITLFDLVVMYLIWREFTIVKKHIKT